MLPIELADGDSAKVYFPYPGAADRLRAYYLAGNVVGRGGTVRVGPKPDQEPGNPERWAARVGEQAADAPKRVTEKRLRSISVDRAAVKKDTEPYLLQQYTNDDGVMILFTEGGLP